jgi:heterodisulfide reductase subunit A
MEKERVEKEQIEQLYKGFTYRHFGDVMVVGGGISGIQAALDLATAGFKVYLVEKSPTIGGKMAQLDKTFPTNDCSMCIESPKFIECDRHPNIEILTYTEVDSVEGEAGDLTVTLIKKPRYVIENKCTGCTARCRFQIRSIKTCRPIKPSISISLKPFLLSLTSMKTACT